MIKGSSVSSERSCYCYSIQRHFRQLCNSNLLGTVWGRPFFVQAWLCPCVPVQLHIWLDKCSAEEFEWLNRPLISNTLHTLGMNWNVNKEPELQIPDLTYSPLLVRPKSNTLLNLVKIFPRMVKTKWIKLHNTVHDFGKGLPKMMARMVKMLTLVFKVEL